MSCSHTTTEWVDEGFTDWDGDWHEDMRQREVSTYGDIDLHRYRCTQCGEIKYYSERARKHYEGGS